MNKTVTINISGIIFHIEEDAYERLGNYLKTVRNRFTAEEGRDEIMMDIESRIAEILQQKTGPSKQVVVMADVEYVVSLMGEPEAISENEVKQEEKSNEEKSSQQNPNRRRWRLYRDTDDKVIGGVCSGLGYYFDLDPVWIRIAFAIAIFFFGTGFLFYILLLIIIPRAETTAEKLEMRGEPVDVNNISRTIKEEFEEFKKKGENFGEEIKTRAKKWRDESRDWRRRNRAQNGFEEFFHGVFRVMGRLLSFLLIFFGIFFLIGLVTSTFALTDFAPRIIMDTLKSFFPDGSHYALAVTAVLLVFGVPILMMIYKGIRMMFRITAKHYAIGITALCLWLLGIVFGITSIFWISKAFSEDERIHENFWLQNPHSDTLYLGVNIDPDMNNNEYNSKWNRRFHLARRWKAVSIDGDRMKFGYPDLQIVPSDNDSIQLVIYKYASGSDKREALELAKAIVYHLTQKDSLLTFNSYFTLGENQPWRDQGVHMELRIPKGKVVFLSASLRGLLNSVENLSNTLDDDMVDRRWKMTNLGLQCIDCAGLEVGENGKPIVTPLPQENDSAKTPKKK